ncbi:hypothetical protein AB0F72_19530 [Actinoplanes sp. NPDC023936]|uniref:hypothetical protein n=1 Tax=Actinoplanes sp. NPDC023936 TaxID=3154910 RepID=UPI0033D70684
MPGSLTLGLAQRAGLHDAVEARVRLPTGTVVDPAGKVAAIFAGDARRLCPDRTSRYRYEPIASTDIEIY